MCQAQTLVGHTTSSCCWCAWRQHPMQQKKNKELQSNDCAVVGHPPNLTSGKAIGSTVHNYATKRRRVRYIHEHGKRQSQPHHDGRSVECSVREWISQVNQSANTPVLFMWALERVTINRSIGVYSIHTSSYYEMI